MAELTPMILGAVKLCAAVLHVEVHLVLAIIHTESNFVIDAKGDRNSKGEPQSFGLMQLHLQGAGHGYPPEFLLHPVFNILLGCRYLHYLDSVYPNHIKLQISAYNQGPAGAAKRGYIYNEGYVTKVLNLRAMYVKEIK